ncbi:hypothetical protein N7532_011721 [Penicillium argentinense]|uniref:Malate dehydrogenase n=1 Tax=Penicillium argentinense TaxID=1131581 RepID=A0A9W9JV44_9EURO|nr:uncharacterized protein N7532_011721 [Penicillium argentinense]KAJ5082678.1 hypothetical protein N7532_011721 [Penicillium argentinense]
MRLLPILLSLVAASTAAPSNFLDDAYDFSEDLAGFYGKVSKYINQLKQNSTPGALGCDVSKIALPSYASGLPSSDGLSPLYVALGRGTQNYTCADSSANSVPEAAGAVANLYNATCIAANHPDLLEMLPGVAYTISLPSKDLARFPPANILLMGHHFFYDSTTPEFNLDLPNKNFGIVMTKKKGSIDAPSTAKKGKYGAVSWLYLTNTTGTVGNYGEVAVYRVDTASGSPPATCEGQPKNIEIAYSANYYFFGK